MRRICPFSSQTHFLELTSHLHLQKTFHLLFQPKVNSIQFKMIDLLTRELVK